MSNATATATVSEVTATAGEIAIAAAAKPGANNATLLKAIWSTRGFLRVNVGAFSDVGGFDVIKSSVANVLKALPPADPASYILRPVDGGAYLDPVPAAE